MIGIFFVKKLAYAFKQSSALKVSSRFSNNFAEMFLNPLLYRTMTIQEHRVRHRRSTDRENTGEKKS